MDNAKLKQTVETAQTGDSDALETLYREYAKPVYYLALKLMKNKEDAEDITQEVFITVFQKIPELKVAETFPTWLNKITANKCTNAVKKAHAHSGINSEETAELEFIEEGDPLLIPDKSLENAETARMIIEIIDELPLPQRICVYYYYYEHLTIAQIAENLNANESTVKTRLAIARDKIRKELERLDKEEGVKLYGAFPLMLAPILRAALKDFQMPIGVAEKMFAAVTSSSASAGTAAVATTSVTGTATSATGAATPVTAAKTAGAVALKTKIIAAVAGLFVAGGITAGVMIAVNSDDDTPTVSVSQEYVSEVKITTAETTEVSEETVDEEVSKALEKRNAALEKAESNAWDIATATSAALRGLKEKGYPFEDDDGIIVYDGQDVTVSLSRKWSEERSPNEDELIGIILGEVVNYSYWQNLEGTAFIVTFHDSIIEAWWAESMTSDVVGYSTGWSKKFYFKDVEGGTLEEITANIVNSGLLEPYNK